MSILESQVLEGRAALASTEADRSGMISELAVAKEAAGRVEEMKANMADATSREEALRAQLAASKKSLEVRNTVFDLSIFSPEENCPIPKNVTPVLPPIQAASSVSENRERCIHK